MRKTKHITNKKIIFIFFLVDLVFALVPAMISFYRFKQNYSEHMSEGFARIFGDFIPPVDVFILVVYWLAVFYLFGHYHRNLNQSVFKIVRSTFGEVLVGNLLLFTVMFGPLRMFEHANSWPVFLTFTMQFFLIISIPRVLTLLVLNKLFDAGYVKLNSIVIGKSDKVKNFIKGFSHAGYLRRFRFLGIMPLDGGTSVDGFAQIVSYKELHDLALMGKIDEVIFIDDANDFRKIRDIITFCKRYNITLNIPGELTDILKGQVVIDDIDAPPFVVIHSKGMPVIERVIKRIIDIILSVTGVLLILPFVPFIVYCIKKTSGGSVFYLQERVGKNGIPFKMLKFRSMFMDAEKDGPALSSGNDKRITKTGRWLRRWRLDEVPQLLNVLAGHMSLVGPRPEREHYLQKILEEAPYYSLVLKVKPGITSLGMVKFGYAENIDEMIRRARYDVLYIENQSLLLDVKIMFYTLGTLLKGEGK
jgi:exopolysaccharide biosynthesis polyprenyl glycosylphosphotransferase